MGSAQELKPWIFRKAYGTTEGNALLSVVMAWQRPWPTEQAHMRPAFAEQTTKRKLRRRRRRAKIGRGIVRRDRRGAGLSLRLLRRTSGSRWICCGRSLWHYRVRRRRSRAGRSRIARRTQQQR